MQKSAYKKRLTTDEARTLAAHVWATRATLGDGATAKAISEMAGVTISRVEYYLWQHKGSPYRGQHPSRSERADQAIARAAPPLRVVVAPPKAEATPAYTLPLDRVKIIPVWYWRQCQHDVGEITQCMDKAAPPHKLCIRHRRRAALCVE
jgi:hypothetical protein